MEPKRKSFSGAVVVVLVVGAAAGVDLRFPRGKACSVMVWCFFSRCYGCEAIGRFAMYDVYGWRDEMWISKNKKQVIGLGNPAIFGSLSSVCLLIS